MEVDEEVVGVAMRASRRLDTDGALGSSELRGERRSICCF